MHTPRSSLQTPQTNLMIFRELALMETREKQQRAILPNVRHRKYKSCSQDVIINMNIHLINTTQNGREPYRKAIKYNSGRQEFVHVYEIKKANANTSTWHKFSLHPTQGGEKYRFSQKKF